MAEDAADLQPGRGGWQESDLQENLGVTAGFKDHFSRVSDGYAKHRPGYPDTLFQFLSSVAPDQDRAWDCATGNGQAAVALARHFSSVVATDASQPQIAAATPHPAIEYRVALAESSGLRDASVDIVTVGQALHWFDQPAFFAEASRVLRHDGVLAAWCYELCAVNAECDAVVAELYEKIVGDYWPPERVMIEQGYGNLRLPGEEIPAPDFEMSLTWRARDMLGYLRTWSACKRYSSEKGSDPVLLVAARLEEVWGSGARKVVWPLKIRVNRLNALLE